MTRVRPADPSTPPTPTPQATSTNSLEILALCVKLSLDIHIRHTHSLLLLLIQQHFKVKPSILPHKPAGPTPGLSGAVRVIPLQRRMGRGGMGRTHAQTVLFMRAHMLVGLLSRLLGHLATRLVADVNMRGHIKSSLCLCGWLQCQQSSLQPCVSVWGPATSCLHVHAHLLLQQDTNLSF